MSIIIGMKWSLAAFAVALVLGFISMGALGAALYYVCYPLLGPFYGSLDNWHGDWVWSATIWAGILWSLTFLVAGGLNLCLTRYAPVLLRAIGYVLVLWFGAALIWALILAISYKAPEASYASPCHDKTIIEMAIRGAPLQLAPADLIRTSCTDPGVPADRIAAAMLGPVDTSKVGFGPIDNAIEAPVSVLVEMFPEALTSEQLERSSVLSNWKAGQNTAVHIIRAPDGTLFLLAHDVL